MVEVIGIKLSFAPGRSHNQQGERSGTKRNFYKDLIVVIACLMVGVSCSLSLECVIKVTRKELLE